MSGQPTGVAFEPAVAFELAAPPRIVFGAGCAREVVPIAASLGRAALVVTGKSAARARMVVEPLEAAGVRTTLFSVTGEPTVETARAGVAAGRAASCDLVIAFGGGSALDAGKALAALRLDPNRGSRITRRGGSRRPRPPRWTGGGHGCWRIGPYLASGRWGRCCG